MRFWDSSAIAPLLVEEGHSAVVRNLLRRDSGQIVWWGSRIECLSAIRRREREGSLNASAVRTAIELLEELAASWAEVLPSDAVRHGAERALAVHPLRAADSLQLAAALVWVDGTPAQAEFVCLDGRLRNAASREGLRAMPIELA